MQTKQNPSAAMPSGDWWSTFFSGLFVELWLKFPTTWPLSPEFPAHMGYRPSQDTPVLAEAEV